jgi:hypothetical protein
MSAISDENKELGNLGLSSNTIRINPQTNKGELVITNNHAAYFIGFKVLS